MAVELARTRLLNVEDLFGPGMPDKFVELVEGELVEMSPGGWQHNDIAVNIFLAFRNFCRGRQDIRCAADNYGFLVGRNPDTVLSPDASMFRGTPEAGKPWLEFAPDLAVEVVSPSNSPMERAMKRRLYFDSGTEQVWQVDPKTKTVEMYFPDGRVLRAGDNSVVECEGIAAGFQLDLARIFADC